MHDLAQLPLMNRDVLWFSARVKLSHMMDRRNRCVKTTIDTVALLNLSFTIVIIATVIRRVSSLLS